MIENNPPVTRAPNLIPPTPPSKPNLVPILIAIIAFISIGGSVFAYNLYQQNLALQEKILSQIPTSAPSPVPTLSDSVPPISPIVSTPSATIGEFGQISWLSTPIKTANPDVLQKNISGDGINYSFDSDLGTIEVASFSGGAKLLVSAVSGDMPGASYVFRIIKDKNQYFLNESIIIDKYLKPELPKIFDQSKIKFIAYDTLGLLPADSLYSTNKIMFISGVAGLGSQPFFSQLKNPVKIDSSSFGDLYAVYTDAYKNSNILGREVYLKLPDSTIISYHTQLYFFTEDNVPYVTIGNQINSQDFQPGIPFKCGLGSASTVVKNGNPLLNDKQEVGFVTNSPNEKIYQIKSSQNELIKMLYSSYKTGRDFPSAPPVLSLDQYLTHNTHFLYQDKLGDWVVFVNSQYSPMVECGKPVIYLYPTTSTQVSVKVAADITKSEPQYPQGGWTVLAHPNGQLDYQGQSYPNLFWEGLGQGIYPNLDQYGTVVSQPSLIPTIKLHLAQLGLNDRETADFLEFWTSKLPSTPYVRLTWLGTADMNRLAPLQVSPLPDTVIRVFLDFAGLDHPVSLTPQKLTALPRRGFTLIEWGGLLIK